MIPGLRFTSIYTSGLLRFAVVVGLVLLLAGGYYLPASLLFFLLLTVEGARLWSIVALRRLEIRRMVEPLCLFPGDEGTMAIKIRNCKRLPFLLYWYQLFPPEMVEECGQEERKERVSFSGRRFIKWHLEFKTKASFIAQKRGFYRFPSLQLAAKDGLGLFHQDKNHQEETPVIVYPQLIPLPEIGLSPDDIIGDRRVSRPLLTDPTRVAGLCEYTSDMPARLINWKASASKNVLLAKILEPTANLQICLAIDVDEYLLPEVDLERFETALSVAASLICWADTHNIPCGLVCNGLQKELESPVAIPVTRNHNHAAVMLEALARLEPCAEQPLESLFNKEVVCFPWGTTLVVVGERIPPAGYAYFRHRVCFDFPKATSAENKPGEEV